jgi:hypothetical protein
MIECGCNHRSNNNNNEAHTHTHSTAVTAAADCGHLLLYVSNDDAYTSSSSHDSRICGKNCAHSDRTAVSRIWVVFNFIIFVIVVVIFFCD